MCDYWTGSSEFWAEAEAEYVTTDCTLADISRESGVPYGTLRKRYKAGDWGTKRRKYRENVVKNAIEEQETKDTEKLARVLDATEKAVDVAVRTLDDREQFQRHIITDGVDAEERIFKKTDTKSLLELSNVLKNLTSMLRDFYDLPTAAQREQRILAQERLNLDRAKADASKSGDQTVRVILSDAAEDYCD